MRSGIVRWAWAAAGLALAGATSPALAGEGDADLRKELEATRGEVRALRERVTELEGRLGEGGTRGDLGRAVEAYLSVHPGGGRGAVTAPGVQSLRFSGHFLFWWERWDRSYRPTDPAGLDVQDIGWLRASLQADAAITDALRARVEIRDARALGQEPATNAQLNAPGGGLDLKEGWFEADGLLGQGTTARAGRQVLAYGDQRLVGDLEWHNYGRSFDGVLLTRTWRKARVDVFGTRVFEGGNGPVVPGADNDDVDFYGVYAQAPEALHHSDLDAYLLGVRSGVAAIGEDGRPGNSTFWTLGARVVGGKGPLDWGAEAAAQRGSLAGDPHAAWAFHARAGYTMTATRWRPRLGVEWNQATGDADATDGTSRSFQTLFPTNHDKYGILDLVAWQNARNFRLSASIRPDERWTVEADVHRFYLDESADAWRAASGAVIRPGAAGASRYLGTEIDLVFTCRASEHMTVSFGGAQFFDGGFVSDTGRGGDTLWLYVRILVSF